jgi:hypothetical protein
MLAFFAPYVRTVVDRAKLLHQIHQQDWYQKMVKILMGVQKWELSLSIAFLYSCRVQSKRRYGTLQRPAIRLYYKSVLQAQQPKMSMLRRQMT